MPRWRHGNFHRLFYPGEALQANRGGALFGGGAVNRAVAEIVRSFFFGSYRLLYRMHRAAEYFIRRQQLAGLSHWQVLLAHMQAVGAGPLERCPGNR